MGGGGGGGRPIHVIEYLLLVPWIWGFPWGFRWGFLWVMGWVWGLKCHPHGSDGIAAHCPLNVVFGDVSLIDCVDIARRSSASRRQTTLRWQKQVFIHTRLSRA